jgi:hypothetical protein
MENVPPEDWSAVLRGLVAAVHVGGPVLLAVEVPQEEDRSALANPPPPLVRGEILFPDGGYHYYPGLDCVTEWVEAAGLEVYPWPKATVARTGAAAVENLPRPRR